MEFNKQNVAGTFCSGFCGACIKFDNRNKSILGSYFVCGVQCTRYYSASGIGKRN